MANYTRIEDLLEGAQPAPASLSQRISDRIAPEMEPVPYGDDERLPIHIAARWILGLIIVSWAMVIGLGYVAVEALYYFFPNFSILPW